MKLSILKFTINIFLILVCDKNNSQYLKQLKIVITGGPGTGKSTIIDHLLKMQFTCMPEISRSITKEAQRSGIDQLFLEDPLLFSRLLLDGRIDQYENASALGSDKVFFDRGIPDIHGYMDYLGTQYPEIYMEKSNEFRYSHVFMMPPWKDIYTTDNERYESFEQSLSIYQYLIEGYKKMNYNIIRVPEGKVIDRVNFILNSL